MSKPRFVAGAVCPQCQSLDRLVIEEIRNAGTRDEQTPKDRTQEKVEQVGSRRRCVSCGFTDDLLDHHAATVPRGKPEKSAAARQASKNVQKIKIFDPKGPSN